MDPCHISHADLITKWVKTLLYCRSPPPSSCTDKTENCKHVVSRIKQMSPGNSLICGSVVQFHETGPSRIAILPDQNICLKFTRVVSLQQLSVDCHSTCISRNIFNLSSGTSINHEKFPESLRHLKNMHHVQDKALLIDPGNRKNGDSNRVLVH